jgi:hypothetical protein
MKPTPGRFSSVIHQLRPSKERMIPDSILFRLLWHQRVPSELNPLWVVQGSMFLNFAYRFAGQALQGGDDFR